MIRPRTGLLALCLAVPMLAPLATRTPPPPTTRAAPPLTTHMPQTVKTHMPQTLAAGTSRAPQAGAGAGSPAARPVTPDGQWQHSALRLPEAWRLSTGEGVLVAVLDTGVNGRHPDLTGSVVPGPDLTGLARAPGRWGHHGTAMASLIAGHGHETPGRAWQRGRVERASTGDPRAAVAGPVGVVGAAPSARILSVRVTLENGDPLRAQGRPGNPGALAAGIRYAVDRGADVISMSLGGGDGSWEGSAAEEEAVQYAISRGAVLVASSGNDGETTNRRNFPAAYPGVIAVGAVDRRLRVAGFSNRQDYVSVVAPGTGIVTADGHGSYVMGDGTSSASALVAGIAALVKGLRPDLSPYQVRTAIERGARQRSAGHSPAYGHGVADAERALREAQRMAGPARAASPPAGRAEPMGRPLSRLPVIAALLALSAVMAARVLTGGRHSP
ncbi:S8 family peptidase [Nonomuraea indica]|uniref:S8 family peptidase n=1 Tax=Nonomuraea indica TaxID=1581193 RepID=UPI000C7E504B|nr:S8 family serine peptidase [Nonomuraea indica]